MTSLTQDECDKIRTLKSFHWSYMPVFNIDWMMGLWFINFITCSQIKYIIKRSKYGEGVFPSNADKQQLVESPDIVYVFWWSFLALLEKIYYEPQQPRQLYFRLHATSAVQRHKLPRLNTSISSSGSIVRVNVAFTCELKTSSIKGLSPDLIRSDIFKLLFLTRAIHRALLAFFLLSNVHY